MNNLCVQPGHFYSPIVDTEYLYNIQEKYWNSEAKNALQDIDFYPTCQLYILELMRLYAKDFNYPKQKNDSDPLAYYNNNGQFGWLDSFSLFCLLRIINPKKVVEIGSGFSTLLMIDVNNKYLNLNATITCVEPYPRDFLKNNNQINLLEERIQDTQLDIFTGLNAGDILFIDSSHVCKTGSDLHFILFNILPLVKSGVIIHFHDIFLPNEYPISWVIDENRSWNEQYFIRTLLTFSRNFRIIFSSSFVSRHLFEIVSEVAGQENAAYGGGSLYILRV